MTASYTGSKDAEIDLAESAAAHFYLGIQRSVH